METRWLDDFIALARTLHFSRAADERNITQPTLSRRIKLLEEEMDVTLIDRNTLPLSLTPAGELFLHNAKEIARLARDTRTQCREIRKQQENRLRFATTQTLYLMFYRSWLQPAADEFDTDIDIDLSSTTWAASDFVNALTMGQCDLLLCYWHPQITFTKALDDERFEHLVVCEEALVPVSAMDPVTGKPLFELPGTKRQPLPYISYHPSSFLRTLIDHTLSNDLDPPHLTTVHENMLSVSAKAMIKEGFGVGWLPRGLVTDNVHYGQLAVVGGHRWQIPLQIRLYRRKDNHRSHLDHFWDGLTQVQGTQRQHEPEL
jgi:DNA-binding transcriptional LysR family regulator